MELEKSIMFLNLYPIATKDISSYKKILTELLKDKDFQKNDCFNNDWKNEWDIRKHFLGKIHKFIDTHVQPEKILCLGQSTIENFLWGREDITKIEEGIFSSKTILPFMESVEAVLGAKEQGV